MLPSRRASCRRVVAAKIDGPQAAQDCGLTALERRDGFGLSRPDIKHAVQVANMKDLRDFPTDPAKPHLAVSEPDPVLQGKQLAQGSTGKERHAREVKDQARTVVLFQDPVSSRPNLLDFQRIGDAPLGRNEPR